MRVAVWQCEPHPLDVEGNLLRLQDALDRASEQDADVLVVPEMFTTGYDIPRRDTHRLAEPCGGPTAQRIAELTVRTGVAVAYGYPERDTDGTVYNSALLVSDGRTVLRHRKMHLFEDLDRSRFTPGNAPPAVADLRGHRVALLICYDVEFPEAVRAAALRGAQVVLVPTANMAGYEIVSRTLVPARAYENGVQIAYANYCGSEGDQDYAGLSVICGPGGAVDTLPAAGEGLLVVEVRDVEGVPPYLADRRVDLFGPGDPGDPRTTPS
ncbi:MULTISPECIES: carbon-nitrogen hydrolase family protein [Micrococcaceae]|uniref:carbon-nitrogen hydrolase family protein n=1 Tax=Micrococcaceae TaxID=1268 RepID=UPI001610B67D|nr:carbon-nitrogen hydrolase family protein [Citricoccus sp.]MBB5747834.1 putative amidohydrolase [Micrococcus sp. TA1]HRO30497.1 carbon-nitrogen hydrolase family protein [Citricoccus sp.]HRO93886.1 carbon-nitrogen hydrolase family protein [Citricoccus sp.]